MILLYVLNFAIFVLTAPLALMPDVFTLPFGLDGAMVKYSAYMHTFLNEFWFLSRVYNDFLILLTVVSSLLILKLFLGSRTPGGERD